MRIDARELLAVGIFGRASLAGRIEKLLKRGRDFSTRASHGRIAASVATLLLFAAASAFAPRWIAFAQRPDRTSFEVASVRPCRADPVPGRRKPGRDPFAPGPLHPGCQTTMSLIQWAYVNFADDRFDPLGSIPISGGPAWINSDRYEIEAESAAPQSRGTMNGSMLRSLLEDRFKLRVRRETREVPVYLLIAADGNPKLQPAKPGNCIAFDADHAPPPVDPAKPLPRLCGMARSTTHGLDAPGVTMANLGRLLSDHLDRNVVDETGITGIFDVHLDLSIEDLGYPVRGSGEPDTPGIRPDAGDVLAAVRAAVRKLGLRLETATRPGEFLVIDHVEKPDAN